MFTIKAEQIDALIKGTDEEFVDFLIAHVKEEFPEKAIKRDDETLRTMIENGIKRAESHNLKTAANITSFVSIMFEIAPNFDEHPQLKSVLDDSEDLPGDRIEKLWLPSVPDRAWAEAEENYSEKAWFSNNFTDRNQV